MNRRQTSSPRSRPHPDNHAIIHRLKEQKGPLFVRVTIITDDLQVLYDTHTKRILGPTFNPEYPVSHPEVLQAFNEGIGYHEEYSNLLGMKFAYFAKTFNFHGKTYVVRTAFPYQYVAELRYDFEMGFILLATLILLLFSLMSWVIIHFLTRPIHQIIRAVRPYQEGLQSELPVIATSSFNPRDDFGKLAYTLNSLSMKIQHQINTLNKMLEMRKDFVANASHELKTPITIIRGFAETLHDNPTLPEETRIDVTSKIVRNCQRMTALIKDLLILSDVENIPSSYLSPCDIKELTKKCCTMLLEVFPEAQISCRCP